MLPAGVHLAVMPQGVEHQNEWQIGSTFWSVHLAVMPQGVEHMNPDAIRDLRSESTSP